MRKKGVYFVTELTEVRKSKSTGSRWASHSLGFSFTTLQMEDLSTSALRSSRPAQSAESAGVRICEMFQRSHKCRLTCKSGGHAHGRTRQACTPAASSLHGTRQHCPMLGDAAQQKKLPRKVRAQENVLQRLFLCLRLSTALGSWVNPRVGQESYGHNLTGPFLLSRERACSVTGGLVPQNNLKSLTG